MMISFKHVAPLLALPLLAPVLGHAQDPSHATEFRMQHPGNGPGGEPRIAFLSHRLGNDHAEGISLLDMNGDGFPDLLSGAYWYENPGANGGEWKRHQFRTVGIHNEFVSDCGEWIVDVDHDGLPDLVTTGWIANGVWVVSQPRREGDRSRDHVEGRKDRRQLRYRRRRVLPTSMATASPIWRWPITTAPVFSGSISARTSHASTTWEE